jgi:hypothetical protein
MRSSTWTSRGNELPKRHGNAVTLHRRFADGSRPYHDAKRCEGTYCPWHNPSQHQMREFPRVIRFDKMGLVERICSHGYGHDDPDSVAFLNNAIDQQYGPDAHKGYALGIHGCDGCCFDPAQRRRNARPRS